MFSLRRLPLLRKSDFFPHLSTLPLQEAVVAEPLQERSLLRLSGTDAHGLLQGLITNDVSHLQSGASSIYTMFLNSRGRILFETIIYRTKEPSVLYIECASDVQSNLAKHLQTYRLRKKVDISIEEERKVWAIYDPTLNESGKCRNLIESFRHNFPEKVLQCEQTESVTRNDSFSLMSHICKEHVLVFKDPRIQELGLRVLCPSSEDVTQLLDVKKGSLYRHLRYTLGVAEGASELTEESFPLESNCDYLHGVSFHKGCYIGQELTARIHHTGVVRKRIMPIVFDKAISEINARKQDILSDNGKVVGKVRGIEGLVGIGLLRVAEVLSAKSLSVCSTNIKTMVPGWWPKEAPKELETREKQ